MIFAVSIPPFGSGMSTFRSRGTEITLIVEELALSRTRIIVSVFDCAQRLAGTVVGAEDQDRLRLARLRDHDAGVWTMRA